MIIDEGVVVVPNDAVKRKIGDIVFAP